MSPLVTTADEPTNPQPTDPDLRFLTQAIDLSEQAKADGRHPFAALVVDAEGEIVAAKGNNSMPPGDPTQHAELSAVAEASRHRTPDQMAASTLYTSAEPCVMCTGAAYWTGIGRIVYALSETRLLELTGDDPENPTMSLDCRTVATAGQRHIEVLGPLLEDEAAAPHVGFWNH